jgi:hypothetical protein
MIDPTKFEKNFTQSAGSCTLASYAVASNYYTRIGIKKFFKDYCKHFKLKGLNGKSVEVMHLKELERLYESHFHLEYTRKNCLGYQIIKELHENSNERSFKISRKFFKLELIREFSNKKNYINKILSEEESLINISYAGLHSVTLGKYGEKLICRDTNLENIKEVDSYTSMGDPKDCLLYRKINL